MKPLFDEAPTSDYRRLPAYPVVFTLAGAVVAHEGETPGRAAKGHVRINVLHWGQHEVYETFDAGLSADVLKHLTAAHEKGLKLAGKVLAYKNGQLLEVDTTK